MIVMEPEGLNHDSHGRVKPWEGASRLITLQHLKFSVASEGSEHRQTRKEEEGRGRKGGETEFLKQNTSLL